VFAIQSTVVGFAGYEFIAGGVLMPVCCLLLAHFPKLKPAAVFAAPVLSLLLGGGLTLFLILEP
jgi:hypothetical protein